MSKALQSHLYEKTVTAENVELILFSDYEPDFPDKQLFYRENNLAYYHAHKWYELFFVEKGQITTIFKTGHSHVIHTGEFMLIPPDVEHFTFIPSDDYVCTVVNFSYTVNVPNCSAAWLSFLEFPMEQCFQGDYECLCVAVFLKNALSAKKLSLAGIYLYAFLIHAAELTVGKLNTLHDFLSDSALSRLYKLDSILIKYYNTDINLDSIAEELNISVRQLSRIIQKHYGCSYRQKITSLRMHQAKLMLASGKSISETAQEIGYSSAKNFHTAFLKYTGITPGSFIRSLSSTSSLEKD